MIKNEKFTAEIIDINDDGNGVCKSPTGQVIFVPNALPGEIVDGTIIFAKKDYAIAKALNIKNLSKNRCPAPCKYFGKCGGCDIMHLTPDAQRLFKQNKVKNIFKKIAKLDILLPPIYFSNNLYYRNKVSLPVNQNNQIGMYHKNTHNICNIDDCIITKPWVKDLISVFNKYLQNSTDIGYNETTNTGNIRHIVAREVNNSFLITVVTTKSSLADEQLLIKLLSKKFKSFGLNININNKIGNTILTDNFKHIYGLTQLMVNNCGINYAITNASFMQVNDDVSNKIYNDILQKINSNQNVINAYSGAGFLTALIAKKAKHCYGLEIVEQAHNLANILAQNNNITNITNILGDCAKTIPQLLLNNKNSNFTLVLDPPRKGCEKSIIQAIINAKISKIIYVSCNPATLARDCMYLTDNGYTLTDIKLYDMFSNTSHIESVAELNLANKI